MYQSFENYFAEEPTRIASGRPCSSKASPGQGIQRAPDEKGVRVVPARRQSHGSRPSTETRPDTAESDTWGLVRFVLTPVAMRRPLALHGVCVTRFLTTQLSKL